ncbi:hypothetical protein REBECCA_14 [Erwinia phage Rebecca]|uniref:Uncharacterized protein n=1 Tax=Erwinia phage Rebecca TaxID=2530026 RepID=A0A482IFK6_9CAUD|nr:hypothetical protein REBECCA_14 [Erwinia phage Rebecca]
MQKRIIDRFGSTSDADVPATVGVPAGAPTTSTAAIAPLPDVNYKVTSVLEDDEYLYFPPEDSQFLINIGAEADDTARRLTKLQEYTTGLLTAIKQLNNLKVNPPTGSTK